MRKIYLLPLLILMLAACTRKQYQIDGLWDAEDGTPVWLVDINAKDTLAQATVQDGRFSFNGKIDEPLYVSVGSGRKRVRMILEPGVITADINERVSYGTPLEDAYMAFNKRFYAFGREQLEEKIALADSMVTANADNIAGALALEDLSYLDDEHFLALYERLGAKYRELAPVQAAHKAIMALKNTAEGKMFTDYVIPGGNPDGTDVKLSDYVGRGKYILLDHWASWCGPCKAEMPYIKKTWDAFHGDRFEVVGIAVSDKREDTEEALQKLDMPWSQILDAQRIPVELYGVKGIPHLILFAPDGTILKRGLRGDDIYAAVAELF